MLVLAQLAEPARERALRGYPLGGGEHPRVAVAAAADDDLERRARRRSPRARPRRRPRRRAAGRRRPAPRRAPRARWRGGRTPRARRRPSPRARARGAATGAGRAGAARRLESRRGATRRASRAPSSARCGRGRPRGDGAPRGRRSTGASSASPRPSAAASGSVRRVERGQLDTRRHRLDRRGGGAGPASGGLRGGPATAAAWPSPEGSFPGSATWSSVPPGRKPRPGGSCIPRTVFSGTPSAASSSSSAMRSTTFAGTIPASAFGSARAPVGGDREVEPERAPVANEARQRVDQLAEVDALEGGGEPRVPVEQDEDPGQRLRVGGGAVLREREHAAAREQQLATLERPRAGGAKSRAVRSSSSPPITEPQCGSASSACSPRVAKSRP